jgi:hypothetical protein
VRMRFVSDQVHLTRWILYQKAQDQWPDLEEKFDELFTNRDTAA